MSLTARLKNKSYIQDIRQSCSDTAGPAKLHAMFAIDNVGDIYEVSFSARPS